MEAVVGKDYYFQPETLENERPVVELNNESAQFLSLHPFYYVRDVDKTQTKSANNVLADMLRDQRCQWENRNIQHGAYYKEYQNRQQLQNSLKTSPSYNLVQHSNQNMVPAEIVQKNPEKKVVDCQSVVGRCDDGVQHNIRGRHYSDCEPTEKGVNTQRRRHEHRSRSSSSSSRSQQSQSSSSRSSSSESDSDQDDKTEHFDRKSVENLSTTYSSNNEMPEIMDVTEQGSAMEEEQQTLEEGDNQSIKTDAGLSKRQTAKKIKKSINTSVQQATNLLKDEMKRDSRKTVMEDDNVVIYQDVYSVVYKNFGDAYKTVQENIDKILEDATLKFSNKLDSIINNKISRTRTSTNIGKDVDSHSYVIITPKAQSDVFHMVTAIDSADLAKKMNRCKGVERLLLEFCKKKEFNVSKLKDIIKEKHMEKSKNDFSFKGDLKHLLKYLAQIINNSTVHEVGDDNYKLTYLSAEKASSKKQQTAGSKKNASKKDEVQRSYTENHSSGDEESCDDRRESECEKDSKKRVSGRRHKRNTREEDVDAENHSDSDNVSAKHKVGGKRKQSPEEYSEDERKYQKVKNRKRSHKEESGDEEDKSAKTRSRQNLKKDLKHDEEEKPSRSKQKPKKNLTHDEDS